jgi:hypothetical protein
MSTLVKVLTAILRLLFRAAVGRTIEDYPPVFHGVIGAGMCGGRGVAGVPARPMGCAHGAPRAAIWRPSGTRCCLVFAAN